MTWQTWPAVRSSSLTPTSGSPALREWVAIRAMGARLEPAIDSMADHQWHRFNNLQAEEAASSLHRSTLDDDQRVICRALLAFEEFAVDASVPE
jgi:hypothetical protein